MGRITAYPGNYSQYWRLRTEKAKVLERQAERQDEKAAKLEAYIRKYGAGPARQAGPRPRAQARTTRARPGRDHARRRRARHAASTRSNAPATSSSRPASCPRRYDTPLFRDLSLTVERGQCVGVIGPNGAGKTTLIKTLIGREKPDQGEVKLGHKVQVGYHDQGLQSLDPDTTVVRAVWPEDDPDWVEGDVRDLLARFGLSGEIVFQTVGQLSGGEKAKAALARLCATSANLLVMDEPTNHLDIWSCEALERSINEFEGTVLVVSHDRYFLNQVADRLIVIADGRARVIEGDYETYQHLVQKEKERAEKGPGQARGGLRPAQPALEPDPAGGHRQDQAKVPLPQGRRDRARDRRAREAGRRARRPARPARHLARSQSRPSALRTGTSRSEDTIGEPLPALGDRTGSELVRGCIPPLPRSERRDDRAAPKAIKLRPCPTHAKS